ncbi:hypothetical protein [Paenibacillus chibensis]|uniref:hypothetical protein n=1 Tax=Paenibacillus chibensis TaxID=59846 RepID=UPI000FD92D77|nr:hypothetical protein [Paenibacillus chibensis]MEC0370112.1 hypothetical protein [Paenibacillus chibensis]
MKKAGVLLYFLVFILCVIGCSTKDEHFNNSSLNQNFPVPKTAELQEKKENSEEYTLKDVKEENGLPDYYRKEIERRGWAEIDRLGSKYTFQNGNKKINLIVLTEKILIQL